MTISLVLTLIWILLVSLIGMMPYPKHKPYGLGMLVAFPFLLGFIAYDYGVIWAVVFFAAALSIYRYPAMFVGKWVLRKLGLRPGQDPRV